MTITCRVTMFFEVGKFGWTETLYDDRHENVTACIDDAIKPSGLALTRATLLPTNITLTAVRVNNVAAKRKGARRFSPGDFAGRGTYVTGAVLKDEDRTEEPSTAALINLDCADDLNRPLLLRGVPDQIVDPAQELRREAEWFRRLSRYYRVLRTGVAQGGQEASGYSMRTISTSAQSRRIAAGQFVIAADGRSARFTPAEPFDVPGPNFAFAASILQQAPAPGWIGKFPASNASGDLLSFDLRSSRVLGTAPAATGGIFTLLLYTYVRIQDATIQRLVNRKTGRPFVLPRGRSSKARQLR
jgi:hypothetical protein